MRAGVRALMVCGALLSYVSAASATASISFVVGCDVHIYDEQLSKIQAVLIRKINAAIRSEIEAWLHDTSEDDVALAVSRYPVSRPVTPFFMPCASLSQLHETFFDVLKEECLLLKKANATRARSLKPLLHAGVLELKDAYIQIQLRGQCREARNVVSRFKTACAATDVLQQSVVGQAISGLQEDSFETAIRLVALPREELYSRSPSLWKRVQERITSTIIPKIVLPELRIEVTELTIYEKKQQDRYAKRCIVAVE